MWALATCSLLRYMSQIFDKKAILDHFWSDFEPDYLSVVGKQEYLSFYQKKIFFCEMESLPLRVTPGAPGHREVRVPAADRRERSEGGGGALEPRGVQTAP